MAFLTRHFVLLWQGQLVSHLGNQAFLIATSLYLMERTGSASLVAGAMMAATIPLVVAGPCGGAIADRHSRRSILLWADFLRAASIGLLGAMVLWQPPAMPSPVLLILAVAGFNGLLSALFVPAFQALVPDLVASDHLPAANAVNQVSAQTSTLVGQALGGVFYVVWGPGPLLLFDALSFAYAGVATWCLPRDRPVPRAGTPARHVLEQYAADTWAGVAYVWGRTGMTGVLATFAGVNCLFMPVFVLLPFYTREVLGAGPEWYGFLLSGSGGGALAGSVAAGVVLRKVQAHAGLVRSCLGGVSGCVMLLAATESAALALVAVLCMGALASIINVTMITAFQSSVPPTVRGRVMALVVALSTAAVPIGMGLGGVLGDRWRASLQLVYLVSAVGMAALAGLSCTLRGFADVFAGGRGGTERPSQPPRPPARI